MRILVDTALNKGEAEYDNMGDVAMLQVAVNRLKKMWPTASIEVLTESRNKLAQYCPGTKSVSRIGRDLWLKEHLILGQYNKFLPKKISSRSSEVRRSLWLKYPALLNSIVHIRFDLRDRDRVKDDIFDFLQAMEHADLFVVCGSGGFADSTREWDMPILSMLGMAIRRNIPTAILGQGMGPLNDPIILSRMKAVLPSVNLIALRGSRGGLKLLESVGVDISTVQTTGDDAIELAYEAKTNEMSSGIGVNLRVAFYSPVEVKEEEIVKSVLQSFARRKDAQMIPVPIAFHSCANDHKTIRKLMEGFDDNTDGGLSLNSPMKVIKQISRCRIVVTGAYHAAVFALAQGIPVICLAKSNYYVAKFLGLEDQFGLGCSTVFLEEKDMPDRLSEAVEKAWDSAEMVRLPLQKAALRQIESSRNVYECLRGLVSLSE